ncbi:MAG: bifunctional riboflavin kinase/FAD synthetase [Chloroflexi bacterium]|nr:bifunctional riboflavin kinase/FAD synthetase [Chloroflexota bacterium]
MKAYEELPAVPPDTGTVLTIGVFDGVHRGHQHLLNCLTDTAAQRGLRSAVLTFVNHPRSVLFPDTCISYISSVEDRLSLLSSNGVDMVVPLTFDLDLSRLRAHQFVELMQERLKMTGMVVGPDFAMGFQREGTPDVLQAIGAERGFSVSVIDPVSVSGERVSSTAIRGAISAGDMARATRYLGRPFALQGRVVKGMSRGKTLGFPTANLEVSKHRLMPGDGVYATWAHLGDSRHMAATNVGVRPTFGEQERMVEVYLLDFNGDLYGQELRVEFIQRLRDELRFDTPEALVAQMHRDVVQAKEALKRLTP